MYPPHGSQTCHVGSGRREPLWPGPRTPRAGPCRPATPGPEILPSACIRAGGAISWCFESAHPRPGTRCAPDQLDAGRNSRSIIDVDRGGDIGQHLDAYLGGDVEQHIDAGRGLIVEQHDRRSGTGRSLGEFRSEDPGRRATRRAPHEEERRGPVCWGATGPRPISWWSAHGRETG